MAKNHTGKILTSSLVALAAAAGLLTYLGILPWATKAEVRELKQDMGQAVQRIDRRMDELHRLFFPGRRD